MRAVQRKIWAKVLSAGPTASREGGQPAHQAGGLGGIQLGT